MIIFKSGVYRIRIERDLDTNIDDMKGDMFCVDLCPDIDPDEIKKHEKDYDDNFYTCGAYGVILEKWNPEVDAGWEHVDSCWGFENWDIHPETGYIMDPNYDNNYVVQEFKALIERGDI